MHPRVSRASRDSSPRRLLCSCRRSRHWPTGGRTSPRAPHAYSRAFPHPPAELSARSTEAGGTVSESLTLPLSNPRQVRVKSEWRCHGISDLVDPGYLALALRAGAPHHTQYHSSSTGLPRGHTSIGWGGVGLGMGNLGTGVGVGDRRTQLGGGGLST